MVQSTKQTKLHYNWGKVNGCGIFTTQGIICDLFLKVILIINFKNIMFHDLCFLSKAGS